MDGKQLKARLPAAALAFRGYNLTNLGRTPELLAHAEYGPIVAQYLARGSQLCSEISRRPVDLVQRVRERRETALETYDEAITLVVASSLAQLAILRECFSMDVAAARLSYGYSLGEITAIVAGGVFELEGALRIPLELADDCVALAGDVTLGVLFSRGQELPLEHVQRQCAHVNGEGRGIIGVSTYLAPNSLLLLGQGDTLDRFALRINAVARERVYLRKNDSRWPPMHTPITWQRHIPNRAALLMNAIPGGFVAPKPAVFSLVTGQANYNDYNCREILTRWTDHPQRLWDGVYATLTQGIETVIHVGPEPNLVPATYRRLRDNVELQLAASLGMRAVSGMVTHPWLNRLLPARTALLRAPLIQHVILEDWLLEQKP
jgi:[acyl-carrier-protein] S-malonyltransferase